LLRSSGAAERGLEVPSLSGGDLITHQCVYEPASAAAERLVVQRNIGNRLHGSAPG